MKTNSLYKLPKRNSKGVLLLLGILTVLGISCTKHFEDYNTDPTGIPTDRLDTATLKTVFRPIQANIFHNYQTAQNLSSDAYSGYMMSPTPFRADYNLNYAFVDSWNQNAFNDMYTYVLGPLNRIAASKLKAAAPEIWGVGLIIKVEAMHRVTDRFGPIPYSKAGTSLTSTPYDSQQDVYNQFFLQLDTAVSNLQTYVAAHSGQRPFQNQDLIFNGDYTKWIKFANSLRLRLAMHIVKADPSTAKLQAEKAMSNSGGLMTDPSDNAAVTITNGTSDLYQITHDWNDNRLNASIATYLTGYKDPRLPVYAAPATDPAFNGQYVGIRIGINIPSKDEYQTYASLNTGNTFTASRAQLLMSAAEVWFLKAEAALRGWSGAGSAQQNYEKGIQVSMQHWGVNIGNYLNDATSTQSAYVDPKNAANNSPALSNITIKWDDAASNEQKLERIMTQKWLAMFPEGQEAWTEFRRTGYPKLFPVVVNKSGGTISTQVQVRRLAYPQIEYSSNAAGVQSGLQSLGGPDNGGTRLWWDVNKGNF
ncbi:SusD/RagB family nutrient-binding outer membrane lipoprotein [Mucilaginibacter sp. Bleaf8]|uniref:SusD/RagB family nutrient-binding outer membrane lipoprotein n=1 Tax=Mucilaginibacter sp. Bleaf8 TaxID=2834430 RepID=UPI001BCF7B58|nr:SusD/RagB family nutrient-binding outer membrane lipoprotein [Mucilaginibacter sp. Bleaf8]MBS7567000.1 SusD/RagB family nutrient-binding outer membrane lipoprotein [Mucilaginibacter sp. Bleaf8]